MQSEVHTEAEAEVETEEAEEETLTDQEKWTEMMTIIETTEKISTRMNKDHIRDIETEDIIKTDTNNLQDTTTILMLDPVAEGALIIEETRGRCKFLGTITIKIMDTLLVADIKITIINIAKKTMEEGQADSTMDHLMGITKEVSLEMTGKMKNS